jgi:hypothetical protein
MDLYEESENAWKELHQLMLKIDSDHWIKTGVHLSLDESRDLAIALLLKNKLGKLGLE